MSTPGRRGELHISEGKELQDDPAIQLVNKRMEKLEAKLNSKIN